MNECFYVGKGKPQRPAQLKRRNKDHSDIVAGLQMLGMPVVVKIIADGLSETAAFDLEISRIAYWRGRGTPLANKTDGGEGFSGFVRPLGIRLSEEAKAKLSAARQGIVFTEEHRRKLAAAKIGRRFSNNEETKKRKSAAAFRREAQRREAGTNRHTLETRRKISAIQSGRPGRKMTPQQIEANRLRGLGSKASAETRLKMSRSRSGRVWITNGSRNTTISVGGVVPPGWRHGMIHHARPVMPTAPD